MHDKFHQRDPDFYKISHVFRANEFLKISEASILDINVVVKFAINVVFTAQMKHMLH